MQNFDQSLAQLKLSAAGNSTELREIESLWSDYRKDLDPVAGFEGLPYRDSDSAGKVGSDTSDARDGSSLSLRAGGRTKSDGQRLADGAGGERHAGGEERRFVAHERRHVATDI